MKINYLSLALSSLVAFANAASWKFNVVNIYGTDYDIGVKYNNQVTKMTSEIYPLYTTTINAGDSTTYKYVLLDKNGKVVEEEEFNRTYNSNTGSINEVYDRETKSVSVPSLPKVYENLYASGTESYQDFAKNEIYTIWANCDDDAYTSLKHNPFLNRYHKNENFANCTINLITPRESYTRRGSLQLVGYNSRLFKKLSWKFKLDKKILGRKTLKVRALAGDPTLMRDKLSSELYRSLGVPVYSGTYSRVMINDDIWGLYSIVDTIGGKWIAANIHGDENARVGYNYKMYSSVPNGPFASLRYLGEDPDDYDDSGSYEVDEVDKQDTEATNQFYRLARFTKMFEDWGNKYSEDQSNAAVEALEKFFDLESLLRQMVIESLTVSYDNFWAQLGNYALYYNPERGRYQIIPYDFDGTFFGSNGSSYYASDYLTDCIGWADNTVPDKYFVNNLMNHRIIKQRFQKIMGQTVNKVFNVNAVNNFIDSVSNLIRDDVEWNFELIDDLDSDIPGYVNHFTLKNFDDNTNYKVVGYDESINYNDAHYGLKQWIQLRGGYCKTYVDSVLGSNANLEDTPAPPPAPVKQTTTVAPKPIPTTTVAANKPATTNGKILIQTKPRLVTTRARISKKVTIKKVVTISKYAPSSQDQNAQPVQYVPPSQDIPPTQDVPPAQNVSPTQFFPPTQRK